jgi:hypothetical protein
MSMVKRVAFAEPSKRQVSHKVATICLSAGEAAWSKNSATHRQPIRHEGVTHLLGTIRYPSVRFAHC